MWHSIHCWNDSELHLISSLCEWESLCKHVTVCGALWFLPEFVSQVFKSSSDKLRCKKCSFIPSLSVLCRCNSVRLPNPPPPITSSRETGPWRAFLPRCYSLVFSLKSSSWKYLATIGEKDFEGRKTTSCSWATHSPSAVVLSSFIIYRLCALIWFLQFGAAVIVFVLVVFFFVCLWNAVTWDGVLPHVHLIVHSAPS